MKDSKKKMKKNMNVVSSVHHDRPSKNKGKIMKNGKKGKTSKKEKKDKGK